MMKQQASANTTTPSPIAPARRPQTPHDFHLLKSIRYEDAAEGALPMKTSKRRFFSPNTRASFPSSEAKRDSGIVHDASTDSQQPSAASGGAAKEPTLPTIVVHDDEPSEPTDRSRSPFRPKKSKESARVGDDQVVSAGIQRVQSFKGIQADIPTATFDDMDLEGLVLDKTDLADTGSLMLAENETTEQISADGDPVRRTGQTAQALESQQEGPHREEHPASAHAPTTGLVTGRRKPSVHMLQAALDGGRVLSAEEITFSTKVRSMYDFGDERAADWIDATLPAAICPPDTPSVTGQGKDTPGVRVDGNTTAKPPPADAKQKLQLPKGNIRASMYSKDPLELAGGIENWEDVDGQDVDRYGFINPIRETSRASAVSNHAEGLHRVATALRSQSDQPRRERKLRRRPSNSRSARSMPPRPSGEGVVRKAPGSMHSLQSRNSMQSKPPSIFSKERRTLAEAANMLTLPPGLTNVAEQEDAGWTASKLKRREWTRDEKWQKMARHVRERPDEKGGGMHFHFDTSDPKLINRTWKGIPDRWRATAWHSFLASSARRRGKYISDQELVAAFHQLQEQSSADDVQIDVDVPRTISMHIMFRRRYRGGQRLLFRVLHAISLYFPETGYVQGMASLAATLLCYYDEENAFVMMVRLWQLRGLEHLYQSGFEGLMTALAEFEHKWLGSGDVAQKLQELGITSTAYGTRWYLTLFNLSIPFQAQLRVWDVFMLLGDASSVVEGKDFGGGDLNVLHATSAALIDAMREILLDSDFENAMKVLTSFVPIKDDDLLMRVAKAEWNMKRRRD